MLPEAEETPFEAKESNMEKQLHQRILELKTFLLPILATKEEARKTPTLAVTGP